MTSDNNLSHIPAKLGLVLGSILVLMGCLSNVSQKPLASPTTKKYETVSDPKPTEKDTNAKDETLKKSEPTAGNHWNIPDGKTPMEHFLNLDKEQSGW
jgi:hypothetical protein